MLSWLVPLWVFLLPVQIELEGFIIPRFAPSDAVLLLAIPVLLAGAWRSASRVWHPGITALALCFALGNAVFYFATGEISRWGLFNKTIGFGVVMLSYAMVGAWASEGWDRVLRLARWFVRVVAAHALLAIVVMALGLSERLGMNWSGGLRLSGFLVDPNAFGGLLVAAFLVALVIYFRRGPLRRPLEGLIICAVLVIGVFLTYSRSCWVGLVGGVALSFMFGRARYRVLSVAVALLLGAAVYYAIPAVLRTDVQQPAWEFSEQMAGRPAPVASRVEMMQEGLKMFRQSPIWGRGLGFFQYGRGSIAIIHNTFVWILVEMGMLGAGVFLWFLFGFLRRSLYGIRRGPEQASALAVGLLCSFAALTGFSLGIEALNQRHWWLIMALISSVWYLSRTTATADGD